jgi:hypothetical protein
VACKADTSKCCARAHLERTLLASQALLEKFEFFPVKCRVQRALEIFQLNVEKEKSGSAPPIKFKTKARLHSNILFSDEQSSVLSTILAFGIQKTA